MGANLSKLYITLAKMSTPTKQTEHWHQVKETAKQKLKAIHTGQEKATDLSKWKQLLKQAKHAFERSVKR